MSNPTELPDLDKLLTACRVAVVSLAHAAEKHGIYQTDYERFLAVVEEFAARRAQPESMVEQIAAVLMYMDDNGVIAWRGTGDDEEDAIDEADAKARTTSEVAKAVESLRAQPEGEAPQADWQSYALNLRAVLERGYKSLASAAMCRTRDGEAAWYAMGEALKLPIPAAQHAESGAPAVVDALRAYVKFAATRRVELGALSPEMESVDAQARAALAAQSQGAQATMRKCSKFGHRCNCATDCDPDKPHSSVAAQQAAAYGALPVEPPRMTTEEAHEYLVNFMERHFTDKTFHRYIRNDQGNRQGLDGDFAWQMARALRLLEAAPSAPGTPEAPKDERKGIELWRATLRACGELPEGYEVRIELENGCGMAVWYDAEGERHVIDGEGYLSDDVNEAVDAAIQRAAQLDGGQEGSESNG